MQHVLATEKAPRRFPYGTWMLCKAWAGGQRLSAVEDNREEQCWNAFATSRPFTSWTWLARSQYPGDTQDFCPGAESGKTNTCSKKAVGSRVNTGGRSDCRRAGGFLPGGDVRQELLLLYSKEL